MQSGGGDLPVDDLDGNLEQRCVRRACGGLTVLVEGGPVARAMKPGPDVGDWASLVSAGGIERQESILRRV